MSRCDIGLLKTHTWRAMLRYPGNPKDPCKEHFPIRASRAVEILSLCK